MLKMIKKIIYNFALDLEKAKNSRIVISYIGCCIMPILAIYVISSMIKNIFIRHK